MDMKIGNIVTIVSEDSVFDGKQAEVVEIEDDGNEDGNIGVKLSSRDEYLLGYCSDESEKIIRFKEDELRVDKDWGIEIKACNLFGKNMWHHLYVMKEEFVSGKDCIHENCKEKTTRRILVNIWGSVYEFDTCDAHAERYHGKCVDDFPVKKELSGTAG
ncbi:MAG: hypothetical protein ACE5F2_01130 [Candidatus Paceibacteria bacterium]